MEVDGASAGILRSVKAGMFAMLRCDEGDALRFRRPFSFADISADDRTFTLYYRAVGDQTRKLASARAGEVLSAILPLGNSFSSPERTQEPVLIAGGIGVAPLLLLTRQFAALGLVKPRFYFGARTVAELSRDYLKTFPADYRLSTDDGSHGYRGTVVHALMHDGIGKNAHVYACGPPAMLKALSVALPDETAVEASLEEMMACGIGACYGCAVRTNGLGSDASRLVCRDGPVFPLRSIRFE
jgi:dihydroorotate dehydrogenase electron transfer subunit